MKNYFETLHSSLSDKDGLLTMRDQLPSAASINLLSEVQDMAQRSQDLYDKLSKIIHLPEIQEIKRNSGIKELFCSGNFINLSLCVSFRSLFSFYFLKNYDKKYLFVQKMPDVGVIVSSNRKKAAIDGDISKKQIMDASKYSYGFHKEVNLCGSGRFEFCGQPITPHVSREGNGICVGGCTSISDVTQDNLLHDFSRFIFALRNGLIAWNISDQLGEKPYANISFSEKGWSPSHEGKFKVPEGYFPVKIETDGIYEVSDKVLSMFDVDNDYVPYAGVLTSKLDKYITKKL